MGQPDGMSSCTSPSGAVTGLDCCAMRGVSVVTEAYAPIDSAWVPSHTPADWDWTSLGDTMLDAAFAEALPQGASQRMLRPNILSTHSHD